MTWHECLRKSTVSVDGQDVPVLAHFDDRTGSRESYHDHVVKVIAALDALIAAHSVVIRSLLRHLGHDLDPFRSFLHDLAWFHDAGKCSIKFQASRLGVRPPMRVRGLDDVLTDHSYPSALLFAMFLVEERPDAIAGHPWLLSFAYVILGHHTRVRSPIDNDVSLILDNELHSRYQATIDHLRAVMGITDGQFQAAFMAIQRASRRMNACLQAIDAEPWLGMLYNLVYSIFTAADLHAARHAFHPPPAPLEGLVADGVKPGLLDAMCRAFDKTQEALRRDRREVNVLRGEMRDIATRNLNAGLDAGARVFFLKMPTGSGKTNTSLQLALEVMKRDESVARLIYVLPFINLLEEAFSTITASLDLREPETCRKIYSGTEFFLEDGPDSGELDQEKVDMATVLNDDDFFNYPVIVTTSVSFFNPILMPTKRYKYRFSQLANSIVVLDEIQSLPMKYWPSITALMIDLAETLNLRFILMTATFPCLDQLVLFDKPIIEPRHLCRLIGAEREGRFFSAFKRNDVAPGPIPRFDLEDEGPFRAFLLETIDLEARRGNRAGMLVFNTIRTSLIVHNMLKEAFPDTDVLLLNSTLLDHARRRVIARAKVRGDRPRLLITTQVVEAGMNLDFDYVIRDLAPIESIEQVRGRCNREMRGIVATVYVVEIFWNSRRDSQIYKDHAGRVALSRELLDRNPDYQVDDIDDYFASIVRSVNLKAEDTDFFNETDNVTFYHRLRFDGKPRFHARIIENVGAASFFIETDIDIEWFSPAQVHFLSDLVAGGYSGIVEGGKIHGHALLEYYRVFIEIPGRNRLVFKLLTSIMTRFITSISTYFLRRVDRRVERALVQVFGDKVGFFHVITSAMIDAGWYSVETGFDKGRMEGMMGGELL